jgi:hypothetical protein
MRPWSQWCDYGLKLNKHKKKNQKKKKERKGTYCEHPRKRERGTGLLNVECSNSNRCHAPQFEPPSGTSWLDFFC